MAVPYVFATIPNGSAIPLSYLDANFAYVLATPSFAGNVSVGGTLSVTGAASFSSTLAVTGATTLGNTLGVTGATTIGGTLSVTGATSLAAISATGAATLGGTLAVTGAATFSSSLSVTGHLTVEGVTSTGATGSGAFVFGTGPTLASPILSGTVRQITSSDVTSSYHDWGDGVSTFARIGGYYDSATSGHLELYALSTTLTEVMRVYGGGVSIKTGAAPTAYLHLAAGTATANTAPLKFNSGTNLTTAEAGAVEYDGTAFYATAVASSRQVMSAEQFVCVGATPVSLTNNITTAQSVFASANDALTLAAATTYFFESYISLSTGAGNHTTAFGFGGTATLTSILYNADLISSAANTIATSISTVEVATANATVLNTASTAVSTRIRLRGVIRVNAGGTIIPQVTFSAGPTGTCQTNTNSFFRIWPVGSNAVEAVGNWV